MTTISFIDHDLTQSLPDCMKSDILNDYDAAILPFLKNYFDDSSAVQVSTSGSTGKPKLIELEKRKMIASARTTLDYFNLKRDHTILLCLPTQFIAGKMIWVRAVEGEMNVLVAKPTSNPIKDLNKKVDFAAMTPHQVSVCLEENPEKFNLINQLIIGGGPVSSKLHNALQKLATKCFATYGMTETVTHVAVKRLNGEDQSDYYHAIGDTTFELGTKDNLIIHVIHLTDEKIETNDVVNLINPTTFEWLGRLDFVVNSGGVKLFPEQIEKKMETLIESNFFVWKETDEVLGEKLILLIEGDLETKPAFDEYLSKLEIPKKIYYVNKFVFTENGKLDRLSTLKKIN